MLWGGACCIKLSSQLFCVFIFQGMFFFFQAVVNCWEGGKYWVRFIGIVWTTFLVCSVFFGWIVEPMSVWRGYDSFDTFGWYPWSLVTSCIYTYQWIVQINLTLNMWTIGRKWSTPIPTVVSKYLNLFILSVISL